MTRYFTSLLLVLAIAASPSIVLAQTGPGGASTNLELWLRADAGVTEASGDVSSWADQSLSGINATQATGASQPDYSANALNFNPGLLFDGTDDFLNTTLDLSAGTMPDVTVFAVYRTMAAAAGAPWGEYDGSQDRLIWNSAGESGDVGSGAAYEAAAGLFATDAVLISTVEYDEDAASGSFVHANGGQLLAFTANHDPGTSNTFEIGALGDDGVTGVFNGYIYEVIVHSQLHSAQDRNQVESYLAVKYGVTLAHDYFASDGTVIRSLGGTYDFRIAAIGRDDASGLNQKQTMSTEPGAVLTVALGSYAVDNASNANSFGSDIEFFSWADDDGSTDIATAFSGSAVNQRMERVWKIKEVNGVSTVELRIPGSLGATHLISDDNNSFTSPIETPLVDNGDGTWSASIDFTNGDFFSFGSFVPAPGGILSDLKLWLRADYGITEAAGDVSAWADASTAGYDFSDVGTSPYSYVADGINFNPVIENIDGSDRNLNNTSAIDLQTVVVVAQPDSPGSCDGMFSEVGVEDEAIRACAGSGSNWSAPGNTEDFGNSSGSGWYNGVTSTDPAHTNAPSILVVQAPASTNIAGGIELAQSTSSHFWHGSIAEVIGFNTTLSATDREKVETYLAIKYGITLVHDYIASDGTSLWALGTYGGYHNDVAGIGRDDASGLDQRQSTGDFVDMGLGSLAVDNMSNATAFSSDMAYMIWGHDNSGTSLQTPIAGTNTNVRMERRWVVAETGTVGSVEVRIPDAYGATHLIVDDNTGFTSPTEVALADNGDGTMSATVDFSNADFFSFGSKVAAPAGLVANLELWLRADAGTNTAVDGGTVSSWLDQSVFGRNAGTGNGTVTYESDAANMVNYQPVIQFNGTVDRLNGADLAMDNITSVTAFYVLVDRGSTDNHTAFTFSGADADHRLEFDNDKWGVWDENTLTMGASPAGSGLVWSVITEHYDGTTASVYANGTLGTSEARTNGIDLDGGSFYTIGASVTTNDSGIFDIAEVIVYSDAVTADMERIQSYLALKYGLTLAHTYTSASGATIWDATANAAYHNDVAGIGRDDVSGLDQRQSMGDILAVGLTAIAADNASNANAFASNETFLVWGHDSGALTESDVMFGVSDAKLLNRKWFVEEVGDVGTVELQFDLNPATITGSTASDIWLVVDTDTDPTNGNRTMVQATSFAAGVATFSGLNLQDGEILMLVTDNPGDVTLPVELTSFEVIYSEEGATLNWTTASETNNAGFEVQRRAASRNGDAQWRAVAFVDGKGTSNSETHYSYVDDVRAMRGRHVEYRLKQIDFDGAFNMSHVAALMLPAPEAYDMSSYPNPFNPVATIAYDVPVAGHIMVKVYDAQGRLVTTLVDQVQEAGSYTVKFDGAGLASGIYVYRMEAEGKSFSKTMMLLK